MRRCLKLLLMVSVCMTAVLAGCGDSGRAAETDSTTIEVKKNGSVTHTIIEDFSAEEYYDLERLKSAIQETCDAYNAGAGGDAVMVKNAEVTDTKVKVVMEYKDTAAYAGYNQQALFTGTVKDAFNAGYDLNVTLLSAKEEGKTIGKEELLGMGEKDIVIVREAVDVRVWGRVLYYSDDVLPTSDAKTATVTDANVLTYIIFE